MEAETKVADVMVTEVVTINPDATLAQAAEVMRDANVGMLPIVEEDGKLRSVVTDRDIVVRAVARGIEPDTTPVKNLDTEDVVSARPEWDVEEAMRLMAERQIGRIPVVDAERRVVGVVTLSSLILRARDQEKVLDTAEEVARRSSRVA
jgi:CBS domain-containing protein